MGDGQLFKLSMKRIIPRLDIKGPNLVKGIHLEGLRVLGSPEIFAQYYYENGADEIIEVSGANESVHFPIPATLRV